MEDLLLSDSSSGLAVIEEDNEFYEKIEAPRFVDFTFPDRTRPDDKSWFCVRIGCDQNHEEVDPDALYRSFWLRVIAARSPNIRLQRALKKQGTRATEKCPNSAPAKHVKNGVSILRSFTSIPEKMAMTKLKQHPISSLRETPSMPKANVRTMASEKATGTSREIKSLTNQETFRSIKQPMAPAPVSKDRNTPVIHTPGLEKCSVKKKQQLNVDDERKQPPTGSAAISSRKCKGSSITKKATAVGSSLKNCCRPIFKEVEENMPRNIIMNAKKDSEEDRVDDDNKENSLVIHENRNMSSTAAISVNPPSEEAKGQKDSFHEQPFQVVKLKLKTTNPKPFRFRTDERGILKEANSERRLQAVSKKGCSKVDGIQKEKETQASCNKRLKKASQRPILKITSSAKSREPASQLYKEKELLIKESQSKQRGHVEGRKAVTVPKEPHFQRINVPKSCTKRSEIAVR